MRQEAQDLSSTAVAAHVKHKTDALVQLRIIQQADAEDIQQDAALEFIKFVRFNRGASKREVYDHIDHRIAEQVHELSHPMQSLDQLLAQGHDIEAAPAFDGDTRRVSHLEPNAQPQ